MHKVRKIWKRELYKKIIYDIIQFINIYIFFYHALNINKFFCNLSNNFYNINSLYDIEILFSSSNKKQI